ncbi:MAG: hypothetical protein AAF959_05255 [Cyanobacteria bacterium P01_D01_bin.56]
MSDYLQSAQNGSIGAIEILMNKSFGSQGVTVRVDKSGPTLKITLKAPGRVGIDRKLASRVTAGLTKIKPKGFTGAIIEGRTINPDKLAWSTRWGVVSAEKKRQGGTSLPKAKVSVGGKDSKGVFKKRLTVAFLGVVAGLGGYMAWVLYAPSLKSEPTSLPDPVQVAESESPAETPPSVESKPPDYSYRDAITQAAAAADRSTTAATQNEWSNAAKAWEESIALMKLVPESSENYATAQSKISEYQGSLEYAQQRSVAPPPTIGASKTSVQNIFEQDAVNFVFKNSPLRDGTPRLLGTAPNSLAIIELYGAKDDLTSATMSTFIGRGVSAELLAAYNLAFLNEVAPGYDWDSELSDSVDALSTGDSEEMRIRAGDNIVSMTLTDVAGVFMLLISVEPG